MSKELQIWKPQGIMLLGHMEVPADMPEEDFLEIVRLVQRYTGDFVNVDSYIGKVIEVAGMIVHDAELPNNQEHPYVDNETGEVPDVVIRPRTVLKVVGVDGKPKDEFYMGFVSAKVAQEAKNIWIPRYGPGDWYNHRFFIPRQLSTKSGRRTLTLELVG